MTPPPAGDLSARSYRSSPRLVHEIAEAIEQRIRDGEWTVGDRVPGERVLVEEFGISRTVLREALSSLETLGLLEARAGQGRYVANPSSAAQEALVRAWLQQHASKMKETDELKALLEGYAVRTMEPSDARECARRARQLLLEQKTALEHGDAIQAAAFDADFHTILCSYCPNAIVRDLAVAIIDSVRMAGVAVFAVKQNGRRSLQQHRAILNALTAGDPSVAAELLERHTLDVRRWDATPTPSPQAAEAAEDLVPGAARV